MTNEIDKAAKRLWLTYKLYGEVSKNQYSDYDSSQFATDSTNNYLDYIMEMLNDHPHWRDSIPAVIENQVRIVKGLCEVYDRPAIREKHTSKSRWSL